MAAITICSDFGAPKNKVWHCFHCFSIYFPWSDGLLSSKYFPYLMIVCILNLCSPGSIHLFIHSFFLQSFCPSIHHPSFHLSTQPSSHPFVHLSFNPSTHLSIIHPSIHRPILPSIHASFSSAVHYPSFHLPIFSSSILLSIHLISIPQPYHLYCLFGNYQKELYTIFDFSSHTWDICICHPRWNTRIATPGVLRCWAGGQQTV